MKTHHYLMLLLLLVTGTVSAQQLLVKQVELHGEQIIFHYSLSDTIPGRGYSINLYASRDNYVNPLTRVSGDLGLEVKPGNNLKVVWNAKEELGASFTGQVSVEIRARAYIPFIQFDGFEKIKRGKPKEITWRGGKSQNILNFELYNHKDEKVHTFANIPSGPGHYNMFIPTEIKTGKDYRFKIVDSKNKDQVVFSNRFTVKRKVPLVLFALPVVAAGGAIAFMGGGEGGLGEIPDPHDKP